MNHLRRVVVLAFAATTALCLLVGSLALWGSHSWNAFVWAEVKTLFPEAGIRILHADSDLREKYELSHELKYNIALRRLIVNKEDKLVATVWREAHVQEYPEPPEGKESWKNSIMHGAYLRVYGWTEAARVGAWILLGIGLSQTTVLVIGLLRARKAQVGN
jgi:hypothetical protein